MYNIRKFQIHHLLHRLFLYFMGMHFWYKYQGIPITIPFIIVSNPPKYQWQDYIFQKLIKNPNP